MKAMVMVIWMGVNPAQVQAVQAQQTVNMEKRDLLQEKQAVKQASVQQAVSSMR